ncbi:MAG: ABC transporter permease [Acidobacteria bacterium]|nr:MAG: ABC transporter permease [Acidobacteriota bacterium]
MTTRYGALALALVTALALVVPWLSPYRHDAIDLSSIKDPPGATHWMGTDELGRDVATRVLTGTRLSLVIGLLGALVATSIGAGLGALAGYYGGLVDAMLMRLVDLQLSVPLLPILIVASALMRPSVALLVLMVAAFAWMEPARITRGELLRLKEQDFTEAARAIGASDARVIIKHLLPNALGPLSVAATILVGRVIVMESVLSFLGLGVQPPEPSLGNLLYGAQASLATEPWLAIFPGMFIFWIVLSVNLLGDELRQ